MTGVTGMTGIQIRITGVTRMTGAAWMIRMT